MKNLISIQWLTELKLNTFLTEFQKTDLSNQVELLDSDERLVNRVPIGKGMLIWQLRKCANGDMQLLAEKTRDANFNWVSIKVAERYATYNTDLIKDAIRELREQRIGVWE